MSAESPRFPRLRRYRFGAAIPATPPGGIVLLVISAMLNETGPFDPHAVTLKAFGGWLYLTVMGTTVTFAAYTWLLRRVPAKLVASYAFVNPVVAVVLGWAILGEKAGRVGPSRRSSGHWFGNRGAADQRFQQCGPHKQQCRRRRTMEVT